MSTKAQTFLSRLPANFAAPKVVAEVTEDITTAFAIVDRFRGNAAEIRRDGRYSDAGHQEQIAASVGKGPIGHMRQLETKITRLREGVNAERAKYELAAPDRTDLVGEMQRREVRDWLRSLPDAERMRVAYEGQDPLVREAIAHAPAALSGVDENARLHVRDTLVSELFGQRIAELEKMDDGLGTAAAAVQLASDDLRRESGLDPTQFAAL